MIGAVALVVVAGTLMYVSDFTAYLGDDPDACNSCHVMDYVYEGWYHGGHKTWATCNDCHTPHALIPKYFVKTRSGINHVSAFLLGDIPAAIRAKESSRQVVQENCLRCHGETVSDIADGQMEAGRYCFECHRSVAHGQRGISILPYQEKENYK
jgi:cytochrome c nitrite reductase small subunit